jgi:hypothetical protein
VFFLFCGAGIYFLPSYWWVFITINIMIIVFKAYGGLDHD